MGKYLEHKLGKALILSTRGSQATRFLDYLLKKNMIKSYNHNFNFSIPFIVGKAPIHILNEIEEFTLNNINDFKYKEVEDV